ncbi:hypothetical protein H0H92_000472 [Tricholoma furcatifolium]|nr:hypothetical protein H0H92_000472 [Tricholoma furcatifolium]
MVPTAKTSLPYDPVRQDAYEPQTTMQPAQIILWAKAKRTTYVPAHPCGNSEWEVLSLSGHGRNLAHEGDWVCLVDANKHTPFPDVTHTALAQLYYAVPRPEGSTRGPNWTTFVAGDCITDKTIVVHVPKTLVENNDIQAAIHADIAWPGTTSTRAEEAINDLIEHILNSPEGTTVHIGEPEIYDVWGFLDIDLLEV